MDARTPSACAEALAAHHGSDGADRPAEGDRLVDYAESPRVGDWTLRSALVRFAQPEPRLASAVLEAIRRTDAALHPHRRMLETSDVATCPSLDATSFVVEGASVRVHCPAGASDARVTDLARALARIDDGDAIVAHYRSAVRLDDDEVTVLPLLVPAVGLGDLADVVATWADAGPADPPVAAVAARLRPVAAALGAAGVPRETGPTRRR